jgi:sorbitol-specific phosphotransferase system component IIA
MDEETEYLVAKVRNAVWSGFYTKEEVTEMLAEWLEDEGGEDDEAALETVLQQELAAKKAAEATWPPITDCDRLDQAFGALWAAGIIALQNAGYTMSDGLDDVAEVRAEGESEGIRGYCFYHGQDLERAVGGKGLMLAFGSFDDEAARKIAVGQTVQAALREVGLVVEWNGEPETRLHLPLIDWKRRGIE